MIDMSKKYKTVNGLDARVLCTDAPGPFPVRVLICESVLSYLAEGNAARAIRGAFDLVEVGPYDDFKMDEPVMVRDSDDRSWRPRYFAGVGSCGRPQTWTMGGTSWSAKGESLVGWNQCRRPTAEELAS